jgi:EAL domain-containing protein (putative c-di-GMP-specific phosphodiesterase class I)
VSVQVFVNEPALQLIGSYDLTHDEIVATVIAAPGRFPRERARFLENDLVRIDEPAQLVHDSLAAARCARDTRLLDDVVCESQCDAAERLHALGQRIHDPELLVVVLVEQQVQLASGTRLRSKEIHLAIDDFGIGYSSLTQLFSMPFNEMKIDRSLVGQITRSKEAWIMVDALVSLAHKLNLTVCAEGVENEDTFEALSKFGCDYAQGYYVSAPVPAVELPKLVSRWERQHHPVLHGHR